MSRSPFGLREIWAEGEQLRVITRRAMVEQLLRLTWQGFRHAPLTSLLTVTTVTVALLLLATFMLVVQNFNAAVTAGQRGLSLSIYFDDQPEAGVLEAMTTELKAHPGVELVTFRDADAALAELRRHIGEQSSLLEGLSDFNPLPSSLEVRMKPRAASAELFSELAASFRGRPGVDFVHYRSGLVGQLAQFIRSLRVAGAIAVSIMLLVTGFIIANTIQLALYTHRQEIEIMQLVGATPGYIRIPFLIEGFCQGVVGAVISLVVLSLGVGLLQGAAAASPVLGLFFGDLIFLSPGAIFLVLLCGVLVGCGGSFLAVRRFSLA